VWALEGKVKIIPVIIEDSFRFDRDDAWMYTNVSAECRTTAIEAVSVSTYPSSGSILTNTWELLRAVVDVVKRSSMVDTGNASQEEEEVHDQRSQFSDRELENLQAIRLAMATNIKRKEN
jgi:hypothetical protein